MNTASQFLYSNKLSSQTSLYAASFFLFTSSISTHLKHESIGIRKTKLHCNARDILNHGFSDIFSRGVAFLFFVQQAFSLFTSSIQHI